jgi:hypothetical protein
MKIRTPAHKRSQTQATTGNTLSNQMCQKNCGRCAAASSWTSADAIFLPDHPVCICASGCSVQHRPGGHNIFAPATRCRGHLMDDAPAIASSACFGEKKNAREPNESVVAEFDPVEKGGGEFRIGQLIKGTVLAVNRNKINFFLWVNP